MAHPSSRHVLANHRQGQVAQAIIEFVSGFFRVLIIIEMLGIVIHYFHVHATSLQPFLFIGIVSTTRSILSVERILD
ncbi:MAG: phosphate-starvation-inducible PsiE family protein [Ktedonobacteraceae bacterium]